MSNLCALTKAYVEIFDRRDIDGIGALMAEDFVLSDPEVTSLKLRQAVLN